MQLTLPEEKRARKWKLLLDSARRRHLLEKKDLKRSILVRNDLILTKHYKAIQKRYTDSTLTELTPVFLT